MYRYKNNPLRIAIASLLLIFLSVCLTGCRQNTEPVSSTGFYFDTFISVTLYDTVDEQRAGEILDGCMVLAGHYEQLFSRTLATSDLSRINSHPCEFVSVDPETAALLQTACEYAALADGLVDPSIGAVSSLWDFHDTASPDIPSDAELTEALSHVDYNKITIQGSQVMLAEEGMILDLGFIAKGYIADRMKEYLLTRDVHSAVISLGGNVLTIGTKPDGAPFHIGIQKPFADTGTSLLTVDIIGQSVVSSGNYERYFKKDGVLYHHILSPLTGYPVDSGLSQVTIISNDSVTGDALSTLCFLSGYEKATALLKAYPDVQAIFVLDDGSVISYNSAITL